MNLSIPCLLRRAPGGSVRHGPGGAYSGTPGQKIVKHGGNIQRAVIGGGIIQKMRYESAVDF